MEQSLVLLKPDAVLRRIVGIRVLENFLKKGFGIENFLELQVSEDLAEKHYAEHKDKPFFPSLKAYIKLCPVVAMMVTGSGIIQTIREMAGATMANKANAETIRGKYGIWGGINVIHASDSSESAKREIRLWRNNTKLGESKGYENTEKYISEWSSKISIDLTPKLKEACKKLSENHDLAKTVRQQIRDYLLAENPYSDKKQIAGLEEAIVNAVLET
jgi:nucleoside-diphosphate kinase